jgi:hypothetical protein
MSAKVQVLEKLAKAQNIIHFNADPQTYSHEQRGRAAHFAKLMPVIFWNA